MRVLLYVVGALLALAGIGVAAFLAFGKGTALIGLSYDAAATLFVGGFVILGLAAVASTIAQAADGADFDAAGPALDPRIMAGGAGLAAGTAMGTQFDKAAASVDTAIDKVSDAANAARQNTADAAADVADKTADTAKVVSDAVTDKVDDAKDAATATIEKVAATTDDAATGREEVTEDKANDVFAPVTPPQTPQINEADKAPEATPDQQPEPAPEPEPEPQQPQGDAAPDEDELYVVEEVVIRGKQARVLSDNTVEAETDEGWMRFENTEHLEEYLDAMGG